MSVLLGDGAGGFASQTRFSVGNNPQSVALGDLNGDGSPDIVTANSSNFNGDVSVLLGDGAGGFATQTRFSVGNGPWSVALGDVNGDGSPDIVTANSSNSSDVSVLLGDGAGGFASQTRFSVGNNPQSVVLGDVNGDGSPDIVTANFFSNDVSVLLGDGAGGFATANTILRGKQSLVRGVG